MLQVTAEAFEIAAPFRRNAPRKEGSLASIRDHQANQDPKPGSDGHRKPWAPLGKLVDRSGCPTHLVIFVAHICEEGVSQLLPDFFDGGRQAAAQLFNLKKGPEKMPLQAPGNDAMVRDGSEGLTQYLEGSWLSEGT